MKGKWYHNQRTVAFMCITVATLALVAAISYFGIDTDLSAKARIQNSIGKCAGRKADIAICMQNAEVSCKNKGGKFSPLPLLSDPKIPGLFTQNWECTVTLPPTPTPKPKPPTPAKPAPTPDPSAGRCKMPVFNKLETATGTYRKPGGSSVINSTYDQVTAKVAADETQCNPGHGNNFYSGDISGAISCPGFLPFRQCTITVKQQAQCCQVSKSPPPAPAKPSKPTTTAAPAPGLVASNKN